MNAVEIEVMERTENRLGAHEANSRVDVAQVVEPEALALPANIGARIARPTSWSQRAAPATKAATRYVAWRSSDWRARS
jgi:hypothetical protein